MNQLKRTLTGILNGLTGISFLTMVVLTCWQVFTRYILKNPSTWSEELVSYLFAWSSLLGAVLVTRERGHMNIPILIEKCGENRQKALNCLCELVGFIFSAIILVYGGIRISTLAMGQMTSSLGVAVGIFYVILPLCGVLNMVYSLINMGMICSGASQSQGSGGQTSKSHTQNTRIQGSLSQARHTLDSQMLNSDKPNSNSTIQNRADSEQPDLSESNPDSSIRKEGR